MVDMSGKLSIIATLSLMRYGYAKRADSSAGEHLPYTQGVVGSKPIPPTMTTVLNGAVAQLVRASACHAEGRESESRQLRHFLTSGMAG
jgi:hypothetical protein